MNEPRYLRYPIDRHSKFRSQTTGDIQCLYAPNFGGPGIVRSPVKYRPPDFLRSPRYVRGPSRYVLQDSSARQRDDASYTSYAGQQPHVPQTPVCPPWPIRFPSTLTRAMPPSFPMKPCARHRSSVSQCSNAGQCVGVLHMTYARYSCDALHCSYAGQTTLVSHWRYTRV